MQEILIQKQQEERELDAKLDEIKKNENKNGEIDLEAMKKNNSDQQFNLKNVIFQRDNLQERLKSAHEEMQKLKEQVDHFKEV